MRSLIVTFLSRTFAWLSCLLILTLSPFVHAEDLSPEETLCSRIMQSKENQPGFFGILQKLGENVNPVVNPALTASPAFHPIEVAPEFRRSLPAIPRRNLIINLGPSEAEVLRAKTAGEFEAYQAIRDQARVEYAKEQKLFATKSVAECNRERVRLNYTIQAVNDLIRRFQALRTPARVEHQKIIQDSLDGVLKEMKPHWELIAAADLNEVHRLLSRTDVANVIIVSHGRDDGKIVDYKGNRFPANFFTSLSPTIRTLSIYACYSDRADEVYELSTALRESESIYAKRAFFTVFNTGAKANSFAGANHIRFFLLHVANQIARLKKESPALKTGNAPTFPIRACTVSFEGYAVDQDSVFTFLNGKYLGPLTSQTTNHEWVFDCNELRTDAPNVVVTTHLGDERWPTVTLDHLSIRVSVDGQESAPLPFREFRLEDGKHSSLKLLFESDANRTIRGVTP